MKPLLPTLLAASLLSSGALATERKHAPELPGVGEGYRIVDEDALTRPVEPELDGLRTGPRHFQVGDWDVRISGEVSFTIGTGSLPNGR